MADILSTEEERLDVPPHGRRGAPRALAAAALEGLLTTTALPEELFTGHGQARRQGRRADQLGGDRSTTAWYTMNEAGSTAPRS